MNDNFCVYLDAGHGGVDASGQYVTEGKWFEHSEGTFHAGSFFYEGVFNRILTDRVAQKLQNLSINYIIVSHEYLDLTLTTRVNTANWYYDNYKKGILISNHANASRSHRARGFELYTYFGNSNADKLADLYWNNVEQLLVKDITADRNRNRRLTEPITMRTDKSDGDHDKEANFYMLRETKMPAVLVEHLFFDNFEDAKLLVDDEVIDRFAEAQIRTIIQYIDKYFRS